MNHELSFTALSEPVVGDPKNRGAIVSKWILDADGDPIAGRRAYDSVFTENAFLGPAPDVGNEAQIRPFSRFCSGSLAGPAHGFDRHIYLTNEEEGTPANTFDGLGGLIVAIFDNELHTLPKLGRFAWENSLVQPRKGNAHGDLVDRGRSRRPRSGVENNQLYMYVGKKERSPGSTRCAATASTTASCTSSARWIRPGTASARSQNGTDDGEWVEIPGAELMDETSSRPPATPSVRMTFVRPEDGAFNPSAPERAFLRHDRLSSGADTASTSSVALLAQMAGDRNPTLTVVYNADQVVAGGGDIAISPDNIDASTHT